MGGNRHHVQSPGREEQRAQLGRHDQERGELSPPATPVGSGPFMLRSARRASARSSFPIRTGGTSPRTTLPR
jgi:hypothetical protein